MLKNMGIMSQSGIVAILFALLLSYQNCGGFSPIASGGRNTGFSLTPPSPTPEPTATPSEGPPKLNSWTDPFPAPEKAADCMTNSKYNICLVGKDPVSTYGQSFNPLFTRQTATTAQENATFVYGALVPTTAFQNTNYQIVIATANKVVPTTNNDWKYRYNGDTKAYIAQISAWYWLNRQLSMMASRSGKFWNSGKNTKVNVRDTTITNNAYFDDLNNSINFGVTTFGIGGNTNTGDLALDTGVITHEAGHANFSVANNGAQSSSAKETCNTSSCFCTSVNGCLGAIHEGQADFHALILFPDNGGAMGAYFFNNLQGLRNVDTVRATRTAQTLYTGTSPNGEIHNVGQAYTAIWYGVWKKHKSMGDEKDIETLFTQHLAGLNGADDFVTAFNTISALAGTLFPAKAAQFRADFRAEYTAMGLTVP